VTPGYRRASDRFRHEVAPAWSEDLIAAGYTKAIETRINLMRPVHRSNRRYRRARLGHRAMVELSLSDHAYLTQA